MTFENKNEWRVPLLIVVVTIVLGIACLIASAETYYLDPATGAGNDANDGKSWEEAWKTMVYAVSIIDANSDTLYMRNTNFEVTHNFWPTDTTIYTVDVNMYGDIKWVFDANYVVGQFASRDVYVVAAPDVNIISILPGSTAATETSLGFKGHGSQINPVAFNQGYTEGMIEAPYQHALNVGWDINDTNNLVLDVNDSLISTRSASSQSTRPMLLSAAILTCVDSAPADGTFRPAYFGTSKDYTYTVSDINYADFKAITPTANALTLHKDVYTDSTDYDETLERIVERPHIAHLSGYHIRDLVPIRNINGYGQEYDGAISAAALGMHLDYTDSQKQRLFVGMIQQGIDTYGLTLGSSSAWKGDGSVVPDFRYSLFVAGLCLNDTDMKAVMGKSGDYLYNAGDFPPTVPGDYVHFRVADQCYYVMAGGIYPVPYGFIDWGTGHYGHGRYYSGTTYDYAELVTDHIGMPNWAEKISTWDVSWEYRNWIGLDDVISTNSYRMATGRTCIGTALSVIMTGQTALWNHDALLDYADRHMTNTDTGGIWASDPITSYRRHFYAMQSEMYDQHRASYTSEWPIWTSAVDEWPPLPPTGFVANPGGFKEVVLSWTAPASAKDGDSATAYRIFRGIEASRTMIANNLDALTYTDTAPAASTSYDYMIYAIDDFGIESVTALEGSGTSGSSGSNTYFLLRN